MENLKENVKKIEEVKKENYKIKENIDKLVDLSTELYHKNYEQFKKNDEQIKRLKNKIKTNEIKIAILKNNIHYLLKMNFEGIKEKMLNYYENKKIGEKTKEKMQNEVKDYFKNNFGVNIACYISFDNFLNNYILILTFYFLNENNCKNFILEYNEEFEIRFEKRAYNDFKTQINYCNNIANYVELKDINKKANELQKEYKKTVEKIEKLRLQQKELYHTFADYLNGFTYYELPIETKITIY